MENEENDVNIDDVNVEVDKADDDVNNLMRVKGSLAFKEIRLPTFLPPTQSFNSFSFFKSTKVPAV